MSKWCAGQDIALKVVHGPNSVGMFVFPLKNVAQGGKLSPSTMTYVLFELIYSFKQLA